MSLSFAIDGGWPLVAARAAHVAACLSILGTATVAALVGRHPAFRTLALASLAVAWLAGAAWLAVEASQLGGLAEIGAVLADTRFGHLLVARVALLTLAAGLLPTRAGLAAFAAALAVATQAGHGHAVSMADAAAWLPVSATAHLLAAGVWLGGLIPLALLLRPPLERAARAARRFSVLGGVCVATLAVTAAAQGWTLSGGLPGLIGTAHGRVLLVKLALFLTLVALAARNRFRLAPALATHPAALARLRRSVTLETVLGLGVVAAAGLLTGLAPGMHEQPVWPFSHRPTLDALADPDLRPELLPALIEAAAALLPVIVAVTVIRRRRYRVALAGALAASGLAVLAAPHLDLLFVPASPTSYFVSPTGFAAASIVQGASLYAGNCAGCHGKRGAGDGPLAASLPLPPADLTAPHLWEHPDGELFWWLTHGIEAPRGGLAMPGFGDRLSEDDRWALIDYIRANNAGQDFAKSGEWPSGVAAPAFDIVCDGKDTSLADLRGSVIRLTADAAPPSSAVSVSLTPSGCAAADPSAASAYAIVLGRDTFAGTVLVGPAGFLRAAQTPEHPTPDLADPPTLDATVARVAAEPAAPPEHHQAMHGMAGMPGM